ncbi:MAG TPA: hypothetical protein VNN80_34055, partial [Polyangiaceae bacterium]|nr:hypothetical protein [Polyangiaceae bacterium]
MRSVSNRAGLLLGLGLVLACDRYEAPAPAGVGGAAGESGAGNAGAAGSGGAGGEGGGAGSAGSSGDGGAPQTAGGSAGTGGVQNIPEECPDDGSDTAQLTLAGLVAPLPAPPSRRDAGASDAGTLDGGAVDAAAPDESAESVVLPGLAGWASVAGMGSTTTLGGAAGRVVTATNAGELQAY